jgi:hypothetical protein
MKSVTEVLTMEPKLSKKTTEPKKTAKVIPIRQTPKMIAFVIKNFSINDFPINYVLEHIWVPIRKKYLLCHCVDIVMTFNHVYINEDVFEKEGIKFSFMNSVAIEHMVDNRGSLKFYQLLTRRDRVNGDIHTFPNDPEKVRVQFISKETFKKWEKAGRLTNRMAREMKVPTHTIVLEQMQNAMLDFAVELEQYAKNWRNFTKGNENLGDPEIEFD